MMRVNIMKYSGIEDRISVTEPCLMFPAFWGSRPFLFPFYWTWHRWPIHLMLLIQTNCSEMRHDDMHCTWLPGDNMIPLRHWATSHCLWLLEFYCILFVQPDNIYFGDQLGSGCCVNSSGFRVIHRALCATTHAAMRLNRLGTQVPLIDIYIGEIYLLEKLNEP